MTPYRCVCDSWSDIILLCVMSLLGMTVGVMSLLLCDGKCDIVQAHVTSLMDM